MKKGAFLLITILCSGCFSHPSSNSDETKVIKYTYGHLDENTMPIMGYLGLYPNLGLNIVEQYQYAKESGINVILLGWGYSQNSTNVELYKALQYAEDNDIKLIINDPSLFEAKDDQFKELFESRNYAKYKSFGGFNIKDEPQNYEFSEINRKRKLFNKYVGDEYIFYVNLLPIDSFDYDSETSVNYIDHMVNYFDAMENPKYISYDFYALNGESPNIKKNYFRNLDVVSNFAIENDIAFQNFALVTEHTVPVMGYDYRNPTYEEISWEVYSSLAYGTKGINYFCYQQPNNNSDTSGHYLNKGGSFINVDGERTETYYLGQKVNKYIKRIESILMNSTKVAMMKHETGKLNAKIEGSFVEEYGKIKSFSSENDIILSVFKYQNKEIYFVCNLDFINSTEFTLKLSEELKFNAYVPDIDNFNLNGKEIQYNLSPGSAILLETI